MMDEARWIAIRPEATDEEIDAAIDAAVSGGEVKKMNPQCCFVGCEADAEFTVTDTKETRPDAAESLERLREGGGGSGGGEVLL